MQVIEVFGYQFVWVVGQWVCIFVYFDVWNYVVVGYVFGEWYVVFG